MPQPSFFLLIGLITGIVIGNFFEISGILIFSFWIIAFIALLIAYRRSFCKLSFSLIFIITALAGVFNISNHTPVSCSNKTILQYIDSGRKTVEGIVIDSSPAYSNKNILIVQCLRVINDGSYAAVEGKARLIVPDYMTFDYGDYIRFHSPLKKISGFHNPGCFDYEKYFGRQGILASGFIANDAQIIVLRKNSAGKIKLHLETFRAYLREVIFNNSPSPQREIIAAMTIGDKKAIPEAIREIFNKTGTSHILAISGLHVGLVAASAFFLTAILLKSSEYLMLRFIIIKIAAASAFVFILFYALIAGMGVTVVRATLMASIFLIALIIGKQKDIYNTLALAGLIILIISPDALFDISFQLSFLAVLSIIYIVPRIPRPSFIDSPTLPLPIAAISRYLYISTAVCIAATIGTLPLIVSYFNRVSLVAVIANLIIVPLLGIMVLTLAMACVFSAFFSAAFAGLFIKAASFFVGLSVALIEKLASLPWSSFNFIKPILPEIVLFYVFIFLLLQLIVFLNKKELGYNFCMRHPAALKYSIIMVLVFFAGDALYLVLKDRFSDNLRITTIDVGQGSSLLIELPGGKKMLIDGGGRADGDFDIGKLVLAPYFYHRRIIKIDTIALTHPHPDHLQGLIHIAENFRVGEVWTTGLRTNDDLFQKWERILERKKINKINMSAQTPPIKINNIDLEIFWPLKPQGTFIDSSAYVAINDSSLVLKLKYKNVSILVTGDISSAVEQSLIKSNRELQSSILIVPHHGSNDSSSYDFIRKVACRYAVISSGRGNVFKHPHPLTIARYEAAGVHIFRTDRDGAITFTTDGTKIDAETFLRYR